VDTTTMDVERGEQRVLTPCQEEVVRLLAAGYSVKEIAAILGRSPSTVYEHLDKRGARKDDRFGLRRRAQCVWCARRQSGAGGGGHPARDDDRRS
jgi:DNA-binding NarL/FixJ family response regulator